tara:strand:+ start:511 stop:990 length:480 start_codon:yes stop_codon:yes gene_type:complete
MSNKKATKAHSKKSASRFYAVQALFQMEASQSSVSVIANEFETHRIGAQIGLHTYNLADLKMFKNILNTAVKEQSRIDKLTDNALKDNWPLKRIDPTLRALFRAAISEIIIDKTPNKAVINEFIEIAKAFFPEGKEVKLVNGVLDNVLSKLQKNSASKY